MGTTTMSVKRTGLIVLLLSVLDQISTFTSFPHDSSTHTANQQQSLLQEARVCRDDYLVITPPRNETSQKNNLYKLLTWNETGSVSMKKKKVTRRELFRFEAYDLQHHQWVIRTSDNRHLAVNEFGNLTVESGCTTTTFMRFVKAEHLQSCYDGLVCKMCLCATLLKGNASFFLSPDLETSQELSVEDCATHKAFRAYLHGSASTESLRKFSISSATVHRDIMSRGLKLLCPNQYDPLGSFRHDNCKATQSVNE